MNEHKRELELITRASNGDKDAFEELVTPFTEPLRTLISARIGQSLRQKLEVDDVLQETLLRAYRSIEYFRWQGKDSLRRWLQGIATPYRFFSFFAKIHA